MTAEGEDRITPLLRFGILFLVVSILVVVLYGLFAGVLKPSAPRTAVEFAIQRAESVIEEYPADGKSWAEYILLLSDYGQRARAWDALEDARKNVTDDSLIYVNNAELDLLLKDQEYEKVMERSKEFIQFDADARGRELERLGQMGIVMPEELKRDRNKPTVELLAYRAQAAAALGQWEDAITALTTAIRADASASDILTMRGYAYLETGDVEKAKADFEEALKYLPDYQPAIDGLSKIETEG